MNIQIRYFNNASDAKHFLETLTNNNYKILRFTTSRYKDEHSDYYSSDYWANSHEVIGQEFDAVAIIIDRHFTYDKNGQLGYKIGTHYSARNMLFQNITRARKRLLIVIIENEELLDRCMAIS